MPRAVVRIRNNRFPEIAARLPDAVARINQEAAKAIELDAKMAMAEPKSGRVYNLGKDKLHQASAPGEAPAIDTGNLANSIDTAQDVRTRWVTYTNVEYAPHLEFGAPNANIAPRPFFAPAAERERPNWLRALQDLEAQLG